MYPSTFPIQNNPKIAALLAAVFALALSVVGSPLGASAAPATSLPVTHLSATSNGVLNLTVQDATGSSVSRGIPGASVAITDGSGKEVAKATTDLHGQALIELPEGIYSAHVTASGYHDGDASGIPIKPGRDFRLVLGLKPAK